MARVLIVDDHDDIRSLVATRLRVDPAFEIVGEAADGVQAIDRVRDLKPELMILDLQMPVMPGEDVIPIIRSLAPRLRVLVFSASHGGIDRLGAGAPPDGEVRKGAGLNPLVRELHRLLGAPLVDIVDVDLGLVDVELAGRAMAAWDRLYPCLRDTAPGPAERADVMALAGVFMALADPFGRAAAAGYDAGAVCFTTRLETGRAARRALLAIDADEAALLEPLRSRLLASLPQTAVLG